MRRNGSIQVRLDLNLFRDVSKQVEAAQQKNRMITEAAVLRMLLREAIVARQGRALPVTEEGFIEGFMRGYSEGHRSLETTLRSQVPTKRSP